MIKYKGRRDNMEKSDVKKFVRAGYAEIAKSVLI